MEVLRPSLGLAWATKGSFNVTLFSDTQTLNLTILLLNFQFMGVVIEGNIKRVPGLIVRILPQLLRLSMPYWRRKVYSS